MRRQFDLPAGDSEYLDATGLEWETIVDGGARWLLVHDRPTHPAFTPATALLALNIVPDFPDGALDMVWFFPPVAPVDGRAVRALSTQQIDGRQFQRWSRHRTSENPWRPGLDDVAAHLLLVDHWLAREVA